MANARSGGRQSWRGILLGATLLAAGALAVLSDLLGLDRYIPFAQLVAFRPYLVAATVLFAVLVALHRRWWPTAAGLVVIAMVGAGLLVPRAVGDGTSAGSERGRVLGVFALNVMQGSADITQVAGLIRRYRPGLISLPEAGVPYARRLERVLAGTGYRLRSVPGAGVREIDTMTVGTARGLGPDRITIGTGGVFPSIEVTGGSLGRLRFVAYHAAAPVPGRMGGWVRDLGRLAQWCADSGPAIVAGDFNATLDHSALRAAISGCRDSAAVLGQGLTPTWPSAWPGWLGAQIDHVLVTEALDPMSFDVFAVDGSDHRGVFARVRVPASRARPARRQRRAP